MHRRRTPRRVEDAMVPLRACLLFVIVPASACTGLISDASSTDTEDTTSTDDDLSTVSPSDCSTAEAFFEHVAWPQVFEAKCIGCHAEGGAGASASTHRLARATEPGYLATNFERLSVLARQKVSDHGGRSILELKPTGVVEHGGAVVLAPGGGLHATLLQWIARVDGLPCDTGAEPPLDTPFYDGITFVEPPLLVRRLALALNGRLPTDTERAMVEASGEAAVEPIVDAMLEDEAFVDRVKEAFDDILLTRGYDSSQGAVLAYEFYPDRVWPNGITDDATRYQASDDYDDALRREPVELVAHIVRNDRPITEILTADYTMVSPYTARGYGIFDAVRSRFRDENDPFEFIDVTLPQLVDRGGRPQPSATGAYPHAGVLSMPQYFHRWETTDTNRNRVRARMFYEHFLGVDVMALAPAVTDAAAVTGAFAVPTMEAPDCTSCHLIVDPVAGVFQDYDNEGDFEFRTGGWHTDMFGPGFEDEPMPDAERSRALAWLAERAVTDPRFATAMAEHAFYVLAYERVLLPPADDTDPLYASHLRAYEAQREAIDAAARALVSASFDFKAAVRSLAASRFYRIGGVETPPEDMRRVAELELVGVGQLLTPERLADRVGATFGWRPGYLSAGSDERMLYGGIDYRQVTERQSTPNGTMGALQRRLANEIACAVVTRELAGEGAPPAPLFPHVDRDTRDEAAVRRNLEHLHELVLGQHAPLPTDVDRSYALFATIVSEGAARVAAGDEDSRLVYECRAHLSSAPDDADYVIRAWQAIVSYLVLRPEFLLW